MKLLCIVQFSINLGGLQCSLKNQFLLPFSILFVLALTCAPLGVRPVYAASTWTVTKLADSNDGACNADCSLREAIAVSAAGDAIIFDPSLSGGTITLSSYLSVTKNLTIDGSSLPTHIGISGSNSMNVFIISNPVTVTLKGFNILNGRANSTGYGGAIYVAASSSVLNVNGVIFSGNTAPGLRGGAIYNNGGGITINVTNSLFSGNGVNYPTNGGAIYNNAGTLNIISSSFISNAVGVQSAGGAIYNTGVTTITNSTFYGNNSNGNPGSAIYNSGSITITNSTFSGNTNSPNGAFYNAGSAMVYNSIFANSTGGPDCVGNPFPSSSQNIIESWNGCTSPITNADPGVVGPGNYGGPTPTLSISGWPAYNNGDMSVLSAH